MGRLRQIKATLRILKQPSCAYNHKEQAALTELNNRKDPADESGELADKKR